MDISKKSKISVKRAKFEVVGYLDTKNLLLGSFPTKLYVVEVDFDTSTPMIQL